MAGLPAQITKDQRLKAGRKTHQNNLARKLASKLIPLKGKRWQDCQ